MHGHARYPEGAPVLVWGAGGVEVKGLDHDLPASVDDIIIITFVFPGGEDPWAGRRSDGVYDYRGPNCIAALRDVILYAAGELTDSLGRTIDDIVPVPVLHDNIGLEGVSNGGNIIVAVAALHGDDLAGHLRYIIQWETPVSSQVATRDLGRVWLEPPIPPREISSTLDTRATGQRCWRWIIVTWHTIPMAPFTKSSTMATATACTRPSLTRSSTSRPPT
jgi:hypothetical protein